MVEYKSYRGMCDDANANAKDRDSDYVPSNQMVSVTFTNFKL